MVAISGLTVLRDRSFLEKKKLASRIISSSHISAMVWAIADFPAPAGPYTHIIKASRSSPHWIHFMILVRTAKRVFGWHLGGSNRSSELWNAAVAVARWRISDASTDSKNLWVSRSIVISERVISERRTRTSKAMVMHIAGIQGECSSTDQRLCVGREYGTHNYAIPGLPEKWKAQSVGSRVRWWWVVIKEQVWGHASPSAAEFWPYLILSYREFDRNKIFRLGELGKSVNNSDHCKMLTIQSILAEAEIPVSGQLWSQRSSWI